MYVSKKEKRKKKEKCTNMQKCGRNLRRGKKKINRDLPQDSRFSKGTNRSTRQGASFLILMFEVNPDCRVSLHHLTQDTTTNNPGKRWRGKGGREEREEEKRRRKRRKGRRDKDSSRIQDIRGHADTAQSFGYNLQLVPSTETTNHTSAIGGRLRAERHESLHGAPGRG